MTDLALIASLAAAVEARPDDLPLRLHLATLLLEVDRTSEAIAHIGQALVRDPSHAPAKALMQRALGSASGASTADRSSDGHEVAEVDHDPLAAYEQELADALPPRFLRSEGTPDPVLGEPDRMFDAEESTVRLSDVGGMTEVKKRLELAFLGPLRRPELRQLYRKSLRGGLLLYGPPGCGKTFLAKAVAGEMGAKLISLSIVDVLDMWLGSSESNLHEMFQTARRNAPCVLFFDEIDALGYKRSHLNSSAMRTTVNQLLAELDGIEGNNDGVFVLAATNAPWDVDPALRRPGRFDRTVLVVPPDQEARHAIVEYHLRERPIERIDISKIVAATDGFSGADLAHLCETAAEQAMHDSIRHGEVRAIRQRDFDDALREVRPSIGSWFATARNVTMFGNQDGSYDDLAKYLKNHKMR